MTKPARIYVDSDTVATSRYVLYDDGTFALQYARSPILEYRGTYAEADGQVGFYWEGWSAAGEWGATGLLTESSLTVRYNIIMQLSDFEDGVYLRAQ